MRQIKLTEAQALKRAIKALYKAWEETDCFDHGGFASHEVLDSVIAKLKDEFTARSQTPPIAKEIGDGRNLSELSRENMEPAARRILHPMRLWDE